MGTIMTPEFRVSYPSVFKPKKNDLSGKELYQLEALFKKGQNLQVLIDAATKAIEAKWGTDKKKWPKELKSPFKDQGKMEKDGTMPVGYEKGAIYISLKSSQRPGIVDQNLQDIIDPADFYGGCYARATVVASAYDQAGNRGVTFYLHNIQKLRDGDPFGNRKKAQDEFSPVELSTGGHDNSASTAAALFG